MVKKDEYLELRELSLEIKPIGIIKTSMQLKFDAPHQPDRSKKQTSIIELLPDSEFYQAVDDLKSFSHIWLIWWFNKNKTWKPKVRPPRGPSIKRGVFATRSPHRPNPIGMTAVKLIKVVKNKIYIGTNDLIDGTPIFDIKPYLPDADIFSDANSGWLDNIELENKLDYQIEFSVTAKKQLKWFESRGINFIDRAKEILLKDPSPHKTRRIKEISQDTYRMGCGGWRIFFKINDKVINIRSFISGYPLENLSPDRSEKIKEYKYHLEFYKDWNE